MITETVRRMVSTSKNSLVKSWETLLIPYHYRVDGFPYIPFSTATIRTTDTASVSIGISWYNVSLILDISS